MHQSRSIGHMQMETHTHIKTTITITIVVMLLSAIIVVCYPYFFRKVTGPYIEVEGTVVEICMDEVRISSDSSGLPRYENRSFIGIRATNGTEWGFVEPVNSMSYNYNHGVQIGNHVIVTYGHEVLTGLRVIISITVIDVP